MAHYININNDLIDLGSYLTSEGITKYSSCTTRSDAVSGAILIRDINNPTESSAFGTYNLLITYGTLTSETSSDTINIPFTPECCYYMASEPAIFLQMVRTTSVVSNSQYNTSVSAARNSVSYVTHSTNVSNETTPATGVSYTGSKVTSFDIKTNYAYSSWPASYSWITMAFTS